MSDSYRLTMKPAQPEPSRSGRHPVWPYVDIVKTLAQHPDEWYEVGVIKGEIAEATAQNRVGSLRRNATKMGVHIEGAVRKRSYDVAAVYARAVTADVDPQVGGS